MSRPKHSYIEKTMLGKTRFTRVKECLLSSDSFADHGHSLEVSRQRLGGSHQHQYASSGLAGREWLPRIVKRITERLSPSWSSFFSVRGIGRCLCSSWLGDTIDVFDLITSRKFPSLRRSPFSCENCRHWWAIWPA